MTLDRRVYIVGTDTGVGKTQMACALLEAAVAHRLRVVPYKPVQSGADRPTDAQRLLAATPDHLGLDAADIVAQHYDAPLAPGIAHRAEDFWQPSMPNPRPMHGAVEQLGALERATYPDIVLIEGAGGLNVPMPGATWQIQWIRAMTDRVLVVGRLGLGTINHTLLTIDTLLRDGLRPIGFVLVDTNDAARADPSCHDNERVIAAASGVPCLGRIPHLGPPGTEDPGGWFEPDVFDRLRG